MILNLLNKLSLREKSLLVGFAWIVVLILLSVTMDQWSVTLASITKNKQTLTTQAMWLAKEDTIQEQLLKAIEKVNPEKTFSANKLVAEIESYARQENINYELSSPKTESGDLYNIHSVYLNIRSANIKELLALNSKIHAHFPNLTLAALALSANRMNPTQLDAKLTISSIELNSVFIAKKKNGTSI